MAKTLKEAPISTANARAKLARGLYWKGIDPEVHLGYRKGQHGGVWLVRWRNGSGYRQMPIATADDFIKKGTLDFNGAVKKARNEVSAARIKAKAAADGPILTVRLAAETYVAERDARLSKRAGRHVRSDTARRLARYLLGQPARGKQHAMAAAPLASVALNALKETDLLAWRVGLPGTLKDTAKHRLVTDLKAALNRAFVANRARLDPMTPSVIKYGLKAEANDDDETVSLSRENQILSDSQVSSVIRAAQQVDVSSEWNGDLFRFVVVLAATGARFSQIARMRVGDCQRAASRLLVPVSRKGRGGKSGSIPVPVGRDVLDVLLPATAGRAKDEPLLLRWRYRHVAGSIQWEPVGRGPWQTASELTRPWREIRDVAGLPEVIPYALRHSSIVRGIRQSLPIRLVAALHDTSVQMIEKYYARWIADGLEELVARSVVRLVPYSEDGKNVQIAS